MQAVGAVMREVLPEVRLFWALAMQIGWIVILTGICQFTLRAGVQKLVIQGG